MFKAILSSNKHANISRLLALGVALGLIAAPISPTVAQGIDGVETHVVRPAARINRASNSAAPVQRPRESQKPAPQISGDFARGLELIKADKGPEAFNLASALSDPLSRSVLQWAVIRSVSKGLDPSAIAQLVPALSSFASENYLNDRIEDALMAQKPGNGAVLSVLGGQMPNSLAGQIALAQAYGANGETQRGATIARHIWVNNFLSLEDEADVRKRLGNLLTPKDHWDRAMHLLMHDRASGTERLMDKLTGAQQSLARARIAVSRKAANAQTLIDRVDPSLRSHPLHHFNRAQLARDKGQLETAISHLNKVIGIPPDAGEFWYERRLIIRRLLAGGRSKAAFEASAAYREGPEGRLVEARFHAGWIALSFLNNPTVAAEHFNQMKAISTLPASVTQAHFWLGRAYRAQNPSGDAAKAFGVAAAYSNLYYGQLAREALGQTVVVLRPAPEWRSGTATFNTKPLVRAVRLLNANGGRDLAEHLVRRLIFTVTSASDYVLTAKLAQEINAHHLAILTADTAEKRGTPLDVFNFPKDGLPPTVNIDRAAVYAVARQESRFDVDAISWVGARGLMQLMPATAKETAGKLGIAYSANRLTTDPGYNALLGSSYLKRQLDRYDGSLVLAAAAYNAGGGNVNKWIKSFGDPRKANVDAVSWIEAIPFLETRKYVRRVMGNYLVYRARLGNKLIQPSTALKRIAN